MEWLPIGFYFLGLFIGGMFGYSLCRDRMRKRMRDYLEALPKAQAVVEAQFVSNRPNLDLSPDARKKRSLARVRRRLDDLIDEYDAESESEA